MDQNPSYPLPSGRTTDQSGNLNECHDGDFQCERCSGYSLALKSVGCDNCFSFIIDIEYFGADFESQL